MILVTGAAGKTGQAVIRALLKRDVPIRALVHKGTQIQPVQAMGVSEVLVGDMGSPNMMDQALQGVRAVYHICPNASSEEINIGQIMIRAAQSTSVEHIVYHSVLHPQIELMSHHWQKMRVEEQLFESGLSFTILQPAPYMQNILAYWTDIVERGKYLIPYSVDTRLSCVDLEDVAEVAAIVLCEAGHKEAIYELCGPERLSQTETAQILGRYLGYRVDVEAISVEEWATNARSRGPSDYQVETLTRMFGYYDRYGLLGNSRVLTCLLDRPPTSYAAFVERTIREQQ